MQPPFAQYKLIKKIKDDRFDEESLHQYRLLIQLGVRDFQIAVVAASDHRLLFFEDYILADLHTHQELMQLVKTLFEEHSILQAGFWMEVKVSIKNNKFVQVPAAVFQSDKALDYLKFNARVDTTAETVLFCQNTTQDIVTVFAIQSDLYEWLCGIYKNTKLNFFHQSAALIEGVSVYSNKLSNSPLYLYVDRFKLHVLSAQKGKLIYYNQFVISQFSDYVKYIMLAMNGLKMDQQTSEVLLWGYIGKKSPHYTEFVKYIRNVNFGTRPENLGFGYMFDEVQEHHFFDLYSLDLLSA
ncbi:MAG: DUF3822 family protein [Cytophagales bacterium]|nr:DUF3822 family protein [Cytophagales bacterium]MCA6386751.1 DUF3822 family protein [Cytophagales bacterium]MCA6391618.1 DUF3822 family protein [Cytophagales bacterium]MCA6396781.1 DUF3822 family protein [Cytophagales bacterium]MCA6399225.1 DUF3822 family protein [Cytophagales bacterium]